MSAQRPDPIARWLALSDRAGRATSVRAMRTDAPRRPVAAAAGAGLLTIAVAVIAIALVLRPGGAPSASNAAPSSGPVAASDSDRAFRLELGLLAAAYTTVDEIEPVAKVTWLGPGASKTVFHAASPVLFRIEEVGGQRQMDGGMDQPCLSTVFTNGVALPYPFEKSGSPTDDAAAGFDRAWYEDPILRLPAGRWRISAALDATLGECGAAAERHQLTVSVEITVTRAVAQLDPVTAQTDDGTFRLQLTTPRGIYGPDDEIEPVARVTYLGPNAEMAMYHGGSPVLFTIEEVGGDRRMDGGMRLPCLNTVVEQDMPISFPFVKSGAIGQSFDRSWFDDTHLRLPVGTWRLRVGLIVATTDGTDTCGGISHDLTVDNVIQVVDGLPATSPAPPTQAPATPTTAATPSSPQESAQPVAEDGSFRLELTVPSDTYAANEAIEPVAILTFIGAGETVTFGHSDPAVGFSIEQLDGDAQMGGGGADSCNVTTLPRDEPAKIPFHKSGQIGLGFDEAWFRDPVLRLPPGTWRIRVWFEGGIPACEIGADQHALRADRVITAR